MNLQIGAQVTVKVPNIDDNVRKGTVIAGPHLLGSWTLFKVAFTGRDNWVPAEWIQPALRVV